MSRLIIALDLPMPDADDVGGIDQMVEGFHNIPLPRGIAKADCLIHEAMGESADLMVALFHLGNLMPSEQRRDLLEWFEALSTNIGHADQGLPHITKQELTAGRR